MIGKCLRAIKLLFDRPKKDQVYLCDSFFYMAGSLVEQVLHGLTDIEGNTLFTRWDGKDTYRLTIKSTCMPYYLCDAEVLVRSKSEGNAFSWRKRSQPRKIAKERFYSMILSGVIIRSKE